MKHIQYPLAEDVRKELMYDNGLLFWRRPSGRRILDKPVGTPGSNDYLSINWQMPEGRRKLLNHRLVWLMFREQLPPLIDHINRNKQDNRIENLRPLTYGENARNCGNKNLKYNLPRGVTIQRGKYKAQIKLNKRTTHIGIYDELADAVAAYEKFVARLKAANALEGQPSFL